MNFIIFILLDDVVNLYYTYVVNLKEVEMTIKQTLESRMSYRIKRGKAFVYVPGDFTDLSDSDQIGRVFRSLVQAGLLVKIGQGIYARAKISSLTGQPVPEKSLRDLAIEALSKLGVEVAPSRYELAYNSGQTTQVPTGRVIGVKGRISRKISYNGRSITFEKAAEQRRNH